MQTISFNTAAAKQQCDKSHTVCKWCYRLKHHFTIPFPSPLLRGREKQSDPPCYSGCRGLTSAAELFPGWGHPALWCLLALPTPWSWYCPEAADAETDEWEGREDRVRNEVQYEAIRTEKEHNIRSEDNKGWNGCKENKKGGRMRAERTCVVHRRREELPAAVSNKTKSHRKEIQTPPTARDQESQTMYEWQEMLADKKTIQKNSTWEQNLAFSVQQAYPTHSTYWRSKRDYTF